MRLKRKKERKTEKKNCKEGRGKKPKIQACLNSQEIRKVNKVKKQNKTNKNMHDQSVLACVTAAHALV